MEGEVPLARYVGESARSAKERFGEHWDDAMKKRPDSHIYKHWQNQHGGQKTAFKFKVVSFHNSPLDRQVSEAVRIARTGAGKILNSKGEYNRCELPRIISVDTREIPTLGDSENLGENEDQETASQGMVEVTVKEDKKKRKKDRLRDLLRWGEEQPGCNWVEEILSDGDESLVDILEELCEVEERAEEEEPEVIRKQTKVTDWGVTVTKGRVKQGKEKQAEATKKPLLQKTLLDWWSQSGRKVDNDTFVLAGEVVAEPSRTHKEQTPRDEDKPTVLEVQIGTEVEELSGACAAEQQQQLLAEGSPPAPRCETMRSVVEEVSRGVEGQGGSMEEGGVVRIELGDRGRNSASVATISEQEEVPKVEEVGGSTLSELGKGRKMSALIECKVVRTKGIGISNLEGMGVGAGVGGSKEVKEDGIERSGCPKVERVGKGLFRWLGDTVSRGQAKLLEEERDLERIYWHRWWKEERFRSQSKKRSRGGTRIEPKTTSMEPPWISKEKYKTVELGMVEDAEVQSNTAKETPRKDHVSKSHSSNILYTGLEVGPGGPGGKCHHQGSGAPHDMWRGGTKVPLSTGLGGPLQNPY